MKRVAITGMGVISPLGNDAETFFAALASGRSGISRLNEPFCERLISPIAAKASFDGADYFPPPKSRMLDRASQFALAATKQAVDAAEIRFTAENASNAGVFIGSGMGGAQTTDEGYETIYRENSDRVKPFSVLMAMTNAAASWIGIDHNLSGPNLTFSTACSSSAVAIGEAWRRIRNGEATIMIAGGTEAPLTFGTLKAWEALRTLASIDPVDASMSCKPFSKNRTGIVLGEGAAIVILEAWEHAIARGAPIQGELVGYGLSTDCAHITRPTVDGQVRAMCLALESANLSPAKIDYINAHGTGTPANDPVETAAIKQVFQSHAHRVAISSTKSMHGHLLGASGALEFVIAMMAMGKKTIPPTINLQVQDPECDLDYVPVQARTNVDMKTVMSNSFAFGGTNAVLIMRLADM